jgi:rubrerythrin
MKVATSPRILVGAMKEHELVISQLYGVYADKIPQYREFWKEISDEEVQHAEILEALFHHAQNNPDEFIVERFSVTTVENSIKNVRRFIKEAESTDISMEKALPIAMFLEQSLIESDYFEILAGDSPKTQRILEHLAVGTKEHYEKMQKLARKLQERM